MGIGVQRERGFRVAQNAGERFGILFVKPPGFENLRDFFVSAGAAAGHPVR